MWPLNHTLTKFCIYVQTFSYYTHSCIVWRTAVDDAIVFVAVIPDHIDGTAPIALQTQPHSTRHSIMTAAPPLASVGRCYFVCLRTDKNRASSCAIFIVNAPLCASRNPPSIVFVLPAFLSLSYMLLHTHTRTLIAPTWQGRESCGWTEHRHRLFNLISSKLEGYSR